MSNQSICFPSANKLYECLVERSQKRVVDVTKPMPQLNDDLATDIAIQKGTVVLARVLGRKCTTVAKLDQLKVDSLESMRRFVEAPLSRREGEIVMQEVADQMFQNLRDCAQEPFLKRRFRKS